MTLRVGDQMLVLIVVLALITGFDAKSIHKHVARNSRAFTLEEILSGEFSSRGFTGTWISGTEFLYTHMTTGNVMKYNAEHNTDVIFVDRPVLADYSATSYELAPDGRFLLIGYDTLAGFRHSTASRFVLYDLDTNVYHDINNGEHLQLVQLQPNGSGLVYVYDNNIYFRRNLGVNQEVALTTSGIPDVFYNGVPDWVYEEEVLGSGSAMWFSPDGKTLAYASFDDTTVETESYVEYGIPGNLGHQYSKTHNIKYPKPGTKNPKVNLHVVDLENETPAFHEDLAFPPNDDNLILFTVAWANDYHVAAVWTNRVQNMALTRIYTASTGVYDDVHNQREFDGWLDVVTPVFNTLGDSFLSILPQDQGDAGNYRQLTQVSVYSGTETPLTYGRSTVTNIYGWDTENSLIYFQGTPEDEPTQRHVYSVTQFGDLLNCLSCDVLTPEGNPCKFASASFSKDLRYMALTCSGPDPIHVRIVRTSALTSIMWESNDAVRSKLTEKDLPEIVNTDVEVATGLKAKARLWLPPGIDKSGNTKYPMLVYVYGGPNSVLISDAFSLGFGAFVTTNRSIIYGMIDGRGSGLKGDRMRFNIYKKLGTNEVLDQIGVTLNLQFMYPFIDRTRVGIWGWSYGGYATAMALARDSMNVFKCGAAVAPVSSWIYYDTIYTERYMGLPTSADNLAGYNNGDVNRFARAFRGKEFYLLHGNADDNVHYIQAMALARALEENNILFRQQSYPDENHSIGNLVRHVYSSLDHFWEECFDL